MKTTLTLMLSVLLGYASMAAAESIANLRGETAIGEQGEPPAMSQVENKDVKRKRAYPMQPPTIPHKIDNYQVDLNTNKCLSCHSRHRTEESNAPMISVTHYMDRDGNFLAAVSPRRYFCGQCHVPQQDVKSTIPNSFKDIDELLRNETGR